MSVAVEKLICPNCRRALLALDTGSTPLLFKCGHCASNGHSPIPTAVLYGFVALMLGLCIVMLWVRLS